MDGRTLFFMRTLDESPLLAQPLAGGPERQLVECVSSFAVVPAGLYYKGCWEANASLFLRDPATGRGRLLGKLADTPHGFTVSPDGKTILYTRELGEGSDLMMIEDFR
jgi:hypothetical protein